jgi:uncharacterized protein (UPF0248 family)
MITIRELLNRIRWDRDYGQGEFTIGYYDRLVGRIVLVPLARVRFEPGERSSFRLTDRTGEPLSIPLHRIRQVYRNDQLIWCRTRQGNGRTGGE